MYELFGIPQSKLRTYGNGNHVNYLLGDDHLILREELGLGKFCRIRIFILIFLSGHYNVECGGQARLFFYFLGHTDQITKKHVFIFKFLSAIIFISKTSPNQMVVPLYIISTY